MMRRDETGRLRFAGALLLAAMFAVGTLAGVAFAQFSPFGAQAQTQAPDCRDRDDRRRGSIYDDLGLTADQQGRIQSILETRKQDMAAFWDENRPRMEMIVDSARAEIRSVLTEEQRTELDRRRAERRRQHEEREAREKDERNR
jgi:Spy/CpxP family protein refolding chaperone